MIRVRDKGGGGVRDNGGVRVRDKGRDKDSG